MFLLLPTAAAKVADQHEACLAAGGGVHSVTMVRGLDWGSIDGQSLVTRATAIGVVDKTYLVEAELPCGRNIVYFDIRLGSRNECYCYNLVVKAGEKTFWPPTPPYVCKCRLVTPEVPFPQPFTYTFGHRYAIWMDLSNLAPCPQHILMI